MSPSLAAAWYLLAQAAPDSTPTTVLIATFAGYGITGILAGLYILDLRKRDAANAVTVTNILTTISPVLAENRDVMRLTQEAQRTAAEASRATSEALERFADRLPTVDELARVRIALERLDRR